MVSVESASYVRRYSHYSQNLTSPQSIDLTTVLTSITVTSTPDPNSVTSVPSPLTTFEPPFLVVGTTTEPFLVQVELMFNASTSGPGQDGQKVILEPWVGVCSYTLLVTSLDS